MSPELEKFTDFYQNFSIEKIDALFELYDSDSVFKDPVHEIVGVDALVEYFQRLCSELNHCRFEFHSCLQESNKAFLNWTMHYSHPRIKGGKHLTLNGASEIHFVNGKVDLHSDFYDMGAMLYEHLPLVGSVVKRLKQRLA